MNRIECGCKGHLIVAPDCHWHRHTQIGAAYRVSTIGEYRPRTGRNNNDIGPRKTIGSGADEFFETMVFRTLPEREPDNEGCACHPVDDYTELECDRYATAGEAAIGHERAVRKYMRKRS